MRINKFVSLSLGVARRAADEMIIHKKIQVNKKHASLGLQVSERDRVEFIENSTTQLLKLPQKQKAKILLVYKPAKVLTSTQNEGGKKTIYDILPSHYKHFKYAGRLDYMSEGLLLLSNDGRLIHTLTHPRFGNHKVYIVTLARALSRRHLDQYSRGITITGEQGESILLRGMNVYDFFSSERMFRKYSYLNIKPDVPTYIFELSEGRYHQIRKAAEYFGNKVHRLIRISVGKYSIDRELYKRKWKLV